jgi:hypothetical protein
MPREAPNTAQLIELFSSSLLKPIQMDVDIHEPAAL